MADSIALAANTSSDNDQSRKENVKTNSSPNDQLLSEDGEMDTGGGGGGGSDGDQAGSHQGQPPDGGYGWVIVFCSIMCGWIISTNFTGFSMLYVALTDYFQSDKGVTGWIGSCHIATGNFLGLYT